MYDIAIIGAGVTGCAIARELSRYQAGICVIEREEDVCCGTSKANSAIIHAGFDAKPGTLKAKLNVEGNAMMDTLSKDLDIPFVRNGSLVVCTDEQDASELERLLEQGKGNGVKDLRILDREALHTMEPNLDDHVTSALYAPTGGIVCPFHMTIAFAENAVANGVEFFLNTAVTSITSLEDGYLISTDKQDITAKTVVNAAGVYADVFHNMVSSKKLHITARKGEYQLLDKSAGTHVSHTIFQLPGKYGKGILVSPTIHGNLLLGPTAVDVEDKENTATTAKELSDVISKSAVSVKGIPYNQVITSFSGVRAHEDGDDFVIGEAEDAEGFFDAAGIESPGLTSAPAIGVYLAEQIAAKASAERKKNFISTRKGIPRLNHMSFEERAELIRKRPEYGTIVCRCEGISEGEIMDAVHRPVGAVSMDGVKRRTRQGMGRCQGGFCTPKAMEIIARELGCAMEDICKNQPGSELLVKNGGMEA